MRSLSKKVTIHQVILLWTIITLIIAAFSELYEDEAYYWMYSRFLDWGYFDHPPMVALFIWLGSWIPGELGVRLFSVLAVSGALYITFGFTDKKDPLLYGLVLFSIVSLTLIGFLSLPDAALIFFTALFFLSYKRYINSDTPLNALIVGLVIAGLMYSKYHGVLIVFFTLLSNPKILTRRSILIIIVAGALSYMPHILWQFNNDFPSARYHVGSRKANPWNIGMLLEYVGGQPFYYGPFIGVILFITAFRQKTPNLFDRALKYNLIGTLIFFLIISMRVRVEANWTIMIIVPMLALSMKYLVRNPGWEKWARILAYPSIVLLLFIRFHLLFDLIDLPVDITAQMRGHKTFAKEVVDESNGLPIVANRYATAALLTYYSGQEIPALHVDIRKSQYTLWDLDRDFIGKKVVFVNSRMPGKTIVDEEGKKYKLTVIDHLPVYKDLRIIPEHEEIMAKVNVPIDLNYSITTLFPDYLRIQPDNYKTHLYVKIKQEGSDNVFSKASVLIKPDDLLGPTSIRIPVQAPSQNGIYYIEAGIETSNLGVWVNGSPTTLIIQ